MIIFFRGKAATGKSLLAGRLSQRLDIEVITKDTVFDLLLSEGCSWDDANAITYDKLASLIQEKHDANQSVIVDLGLAHTPYFDQFLSKMTLSNKKKFLFDCSNTEVWAKRIQERIDNPAGPNQAFTSVEHAFNHYKKYDILAHSDEIIIDSIGEIRQIEKIIVKALDL